MNKDTLLVLASTILIGVGAGTFILRDPDTMTVLRSLAESAFTKLQTSLQPLITAWNTIPTVYKGIIMAGIPTLFAVFFAWTKSRAMTKLQQTQVQAQSTAKQLTGEVTDAQQQVALLQEQKTKLESEVATLTDQDKGIKTLANSLTEAQSLVEQKQREINGLRDQITALQNAIADLKMREKIVVK